MSRRACTAPGARSGNRRPRARFRRCSSFGFELADDGEPVAEDAEDFFWGSLWELVADAVLHEAERAVAEGQALAEALVGRHAAGAFNLFAGAGVHGIQRRALLLD